MNYNSDKTVMFTVEKTKLDRNGNMMRKLTFYKKDENGIMTKYKTARTNEELSCVSADLIVKIWG